MWLALDAGAWVCLLGAAWDPRLLLSAHLAMALVGRKAQKDMQGKMVEVVGSQPSAFARRQLEKFGWTE
jgi:hypothetical protein